LLHGTSFDSKSSLVGNMAVTIGIPSGVEKQGLFLDLLHTQNQKGKKIKNLLAKHCNSM
jgi:hypothetical protein